MLSFQSPHEELALVLYDFIGVVQSPISNLWGTCLKVNLSDERSRSNTHTKSNRSSGQTRGTFVLLPSMWAAIRGMYSRCQQIRTVPLHEKTSSSMLSTLDRGKSLLILIASLSANGVTVSIGRLLPFRFRGLDTYINRGSASEAC